MCFQLSLKELDVTIKRDGDSLDITVLSMVLFEEEFEGLCVFRANQYVGRHGSVYSFYERTGFSLSWR